MKIISKNKKGQLGKLITSFPLLIFIFVLIALFIVISAAMSLSKGGVNGGEQYFVTKSLIQDDLMAQRINFYVGGVFKGEMTALDLIVKQIKNEIDKKTLCDYLEELTYSTYIKDHGILFLHVSEKPITERDYNIDSTFLETTCQISPWFAERTLSDKISGKYPKRKYWINYGLLRFLDIKVNNKLYYIGYYYGSENLQPEEVKL